MNWKTIFAIALASACLGADEPPGGGRDTISQISVINALMVGRYDGEASIAELLKLGDFGLGTLDHLDGELIVLDGRAYQVRGDGAIVDVPPDRSTPFAVVTPFDVDGEFPCPRVASLTELEERLNKTLAGRNAFVAIKIRAKVDSITLRSVKRQEPPYRPLDEVAKSQSMWTHRNVSGTMLGVRSPSWVGNLTVPGYHWHFLSDDHKVGGHILDVRPVEGRVQYDLTRDWDVRLPASADFDAAELNRDLSRELKRVESSRGDAPPK
ncbi:acetolactate decarboxylase [Paludisphaera rhizosphaerae]|uniref:acetolactate decarboxylase n=1 Tax=Paludisphaera rhizosphaerae TaxID=2711216 RepID=UPI0013E9DAFC|nr:acetolactate decarboxylase [Paludisphaera rhizosphaerae]